MSNFKPKTEKIQNIAEFEHSAIFDIKNLLQGSTSIYIDYANVRPWSQKLGWHIDLIRLKQFLDSFSNIKSVNFYNGYIQGDTNSEREKRELENRKYVVRTKPVKIMKFSIDASSVASDSTALLDQFIKRALLRKYEISTIEYLNDRFKDMNRKGELFIEDRKCNFDVEMGVDMLLDCERGNTDTFVLWSGDSDFVDPVQKLLDANKNVILFATARRISKELAELKNKGLIIFDIQKIRNFICRNREIKQKGPQ